MQNLGVSEEGVRRGKGLMKMGLTEEDLQKATTLWRQQGHTVGSGGEHLVHEKKKQERILGVTEGQMKREKALHRMGATEDAFLEEQAKELASLGGSCRCAPCAPARPPRLLTLGTPPPLLTAPPHLFFSRRAKTVHCQLWGRRPRTNFEGWLSSSRVF
jgi:hypothetical protein